ncbi:MAG: hypothetical protein CFH34_00208 [Alphaproteobacteria bacterium MarineAlpha9_Bin4]|nr:hypothetical protein [Pelagibacterales bacterium]PPR27491.1 MAG: hypothetical protein CFH34_00208 [Alphaproteobacteria bacterium MarineAlpha9_Bin4]|tara:strand:+ start:171 stop:689 length:519 start_codon:yes stop_codon:yes gene_type:complete
MLLRHASADVQGFNQENDHEKPLDNQGKIDSKNLSEWLKNNFVDMDLIISSDAIRAVQTSEIVFTPLGISFEKNSSFYLCNYEEIFSTIKRLDEEINNVVIIGHEPSISDAMRALAGSVRPDLEKIFFASYQPCTMSFIYFNKNTWKKLKEKEGTLEGYITPQTIDMKNEKN